MLLICYAPDTPSPEESALQLPLRPRVVKSKSRSLMKLLRKRSVFPFLQLPPEIRQLIYKYVVPDTLVTRNRILKRHRAPLREDSSKCCIGLLLANRQLYHELFLEWYSMVPFRLDIRYGHLDYLKSSLQSCIHLPKSFFYHRKLSIRIRVSPYCYKLDRVNGISLLANICSLLAPHSLRSTQLQEVHFEFRIPPLVTLRYFHPKVWALSGSVLGYLKEYLSPLYQMGAIKVKDQAKVTISVSESNLLYLPDTKRWRALRARERPYDDTLLKNADVLLKKMATVINSTDTCFLMPQ